MYSTIYNPISKTYRNIYTPQGKQILNNYINQLGGKPCRQKIHRTIKLRQDGNKLDLKNFPCFAPRGTKTSHNNFLKNSTEGLEIKTQTLENSILTDLANYVNQENFREIFMYDLKPNKDEKNEQQMLEEMEKRNSMVSDEFIIKNLRLLSNKHNYVFKENRVEVNNDLTNTSSYLKTLFSNNFDKFASDLENAKKLRRLENLYKNLSSANKLNNKYNKKKNKSTVYRHKEDRLLILNWINIAFGFIPKDFKDDTVKERYIYDFINTVSLYYYYKNRAGIGAHNNYNKYSMLLKKFEQANSFNIWLTNNLI